MSETTWNAGPWVVPEPNIENPNFDYLGKRDGFIVQSDSEMDWCIAVVLDDGPNGRSNAHLIAAAPELYEALALLRDIARIRAGNVDEVFQEPLEKADQALAKARGESK